MTTIQQAAEERYADLPDKDVDRWDAVHMQREAFIAGAQWAFEEAAKVAETRVLADELALHNLDREAQLPKLSRIFVQGAKRAAERIRSLSTTTTKEEK